MTVVVCTTLCAFAMDDENTWGSWLKCAEQMEGVNDFFVAIEVDARGLEPFLPLLERLRQINEHYAPPAGVTYVNAAHYWTFSLDDGRTSVTTANRLRHITAGQNLCMDYATAAGASHVLFMAADCEPPPDAIPKLLEVNHPIVGGHVPTYGLSGPPATKFISEHEPMVLAYPAEWDVQVHMPTAAFMLIDRPTFKQLKWRWDADEGMSDDPCYWTDARRLLGVECYVRHDVVGRHVADRYAPRNALENAAAQVYQKQRHNGGTPDGQ